MAGGSTVLRFGIVGTVGFLTDAAVLQALVSLAGWGPLPARLVSFTIAMHVTWLLNRHFTFATDGEAPGTSLLSSLGRYIIVSLAGAGINVGTYALLVLVSSEMARYPIIPLAVGSGAAMVFNYLGSKHFAFRRA